MCQLFWNFVLMLKGKFALNNEMGLFGVWDAYWNASSTVL